MAVSGCVSCAGYAVSGAEPGGILLQSSLSAYAQHGSEPTVKKTAMDDVGGGRAGAHWPSARGPTPLDHHRHHRHCGRTRRPSGVRGRCRIQPESETSDASHSHTECAPSPPLAVSNPGPWTYAAPDPIGCRSGRLLRRRRVHQDHRRAQPHSLKQSDGALGGGRVLLLFRPAFNRICFPSITSCFPLDALFGHYTHAITTHAKLRPLPRLVAYASFQVCPGSRDTHAKVIPSKPPSMRPLF